MWAILTNLKWNCTWSYAASLISEIREDDSHSNWYCSGTGFKGTDFTGFVEESYITPEIQTDLSVIGWITLTNYYVEYPD
jgi:hypothetical protein